MCTSLTDIARLNFNQGKTEEAEKYYKECLDIRRELGDKSGISNTLNNLGFLNFEVGKFADSKALYLEALKLKIELNESSGIISTIHRVFSLLDDSERKHFFEVAKALINDSSKPNQLSQFANLELMQYCFSTEQIEKTIMQEKIKFVAIQNENATLTDVDDLPVDAYYTATHKLVEIGENKMAKIVSGDALKMIGDRRSIRKEFFEEIIQNH